MKEYRSQIINLSSRKILNSQIFQFIKKNVLNDVWKKTNHEKLIDETLLNINKKEIKSIIDVGCGDGLLFPILKEKVPSCRKMVGCDLFSSDVWKRIKIKNLTFFTCPADKIPHSDNSFELIICKDLLHHATKPEAIIKELIRVSKKYVIIIEANRKNPLMNLYTKVQGDEHYTKEKLRRLIKKVKEDGNFQIKSFHAYPFYFPIITFGWLAFPLLFLNIFYMISFKFLRFKILAKIVYKIMVKIIKIPAFNVAIIRSRQ